MSHLNSAPLNSRCQPKSSDSDRFVALVVCTGTAYFYPCPELHEHAQYSIVCCQRSHFCVVGDVPPTRLSIIARAKEFVTSAWRLASVSTASRNACAFRSRVLNERTSDSEDASAFVSTSGSCVCSICCFRCPAGPCFVFKYKQSMICYKSFDCN